MTLEIPDGTRLYYPSWDETEKAALTNLILPKDLEIYTVELFKWEIDENSRPISDVGDYKISASLTEPGTMRVMGLSRTVEFEVLDRCPAGMVHIDDSYVRMQNQNRYRVNLSEYCIDKFEYPNVYGERPLGGLSWYEASSACEANGKRLCTEPEWENACKGTNGYNFPYGTFHKTGLCPDFVGGIQPSGSFPLCNGINDVYDMSGNLWEWVADWMGEYPQGTYSDPQGPVFGFFKVMRGGDSWSAVWDESSCTKRRSKYPDFSGVMVGFRCCSDPE